VSSAQKFRSSVLRNLTDKVGVYALCDLDAQPIYVGQSVDGIRTRVRRHLTSARSDVIANRQIDVWEIAYVWAWPLDDVAEISNLEAAIFAKYDAEMPLMNGKSLSTPDGSVARPAKQTVQIIDDATLRQRLMPAQRLPRQIQQYNLLVDYILNVKDAAHLKRSLNAHFERLIRYHSKFL
jgi:hypothetical protein